MNESEQKKSKTIAQRVGAALLALTIGSSTPSVSALASQEETNTQTVSGTTINAVLESPMDITRYEDDFNNLCNNEKILSFANKLFELTDLKINAVDYWQYINAFSCIYYANAIVSDGTAYEQSQNEIFFTPEEILGAMTILDPTIDNLDRIYGSGNIVSTAKNIEAEKSFCENLRKFSGYSKIPFPFELLKVITENNVEGFKNIHDLNHENEKDQYYLMLHVLETVNLLKEVSGLIAEINIERDKGTPNIECSDRLLVKIYELYVEDENKMPTLGYAAQEMCKAMLMGFIDTATEDELTLHQDIGNDLEGMHIRRDGNDIVITANDKELRIGNADNKKIKHDIYVHNSFAYDIDNENILANLIIKIRRCGCLKLYTKLMEEENDDTLIIVLNTIGEGNSFVEDRELSSEEIADLKDTASKVFDILNNESPYYTELLEELNKLFEVPEKEKEAVPTAQLTEPPKVVKANSSQLENMKLTLGNNEKPTMKRKM